MTPFGAHIRDLRRRRQVAQATMAEALSVTPAYLSALEHGHRGKPSIGLVQQISAFFNLAWDEVDELKRLAELSAPRPSIDTAGLHPKATELVNLLSEKIATLDEEKLDRLLDILRA